MDSKMDSGFLAEGEKLEDDFDVLQEALPEEIVGLMDQVLCLEVRIIGILEPQPFSAADLILILGFLDGMAYGISTLTISIYLLPH